MTLAIWNLGMIFLQIAIVTATAGILARFTALGSPRAAYLCWRAVLVICVAMPLAGPRQTPPAVAPVRTAVAASMPGAPVFSWEPWVFTLLAAGSAVFLFRLLASLWRMRTLVRRSRPMPGETAVRLSEQVTSPVSCGWLRPSILVPPSFLELPPAAQAAIRAHELAHIEGRHWPQMLAEELIRAVYWFHPAVWFVLSRIQVSREQVVDAAVIEQTGDRDAYLNALLSVAGLRCEPAWTPAPAFLRQRHLAERVRAIVHPAIVPRWAAAAGLAALTAACALAVTLAPLRGPSAVPADRIRIGGNRQSARLIHRPRPSYPDTARQSRIQGTVRLSVIVGKDGNVLSAEPIAGHPDLVPNALAAVRQWRYQPTWLNGKPVEVSTIVDINFTLAK